MVILLVISIVAFRQKRSYERSYGLLDREFQKIVQENRSKDQLLSIVSHDLRSSMYSLQINVAKIRSSLSHTLIKEADLFADTSERLVTAIQSLLNNLLYWALSQSGQLSFNPEEVNLQPIIHQVCYDFSAIAASSDLVLSESIAPDLTCTVDVNSLKIVLRNLIDNAIKYTPPKGLIVVSARVENLRCIIAVRDTGRGMSAEMIKAILMGGGSRIQTDNFGRRSTGLGFSLVKDLVGKNGGELEISSEEGRGTEVIIVLHR